MYFALNNQDLSEIIQLKNESAILFPRQIKTDAGNSASTQCIKLYQAKSQSKIHYFHMLDKDLMQKRIVKLLIRLPLVIPTKPLPSLDCVSIYNCLNYAF